MSNIEFTPTDFEFRYDKKTDMFTLVISVEGETMAMPTVPWITFERLLERASYMYEQAKPWHDGLIKIEQVEAIKEVENLQELEEKRREKEQWQPEGKVGQE